VVDRLYNASVLDFGDSVRPQTDQEYVIALERDIRGLSNFATHLFGANLSGASAMILDELRLLPLCTLSSLDVRRAFYNVLLEVKFPFPAGFGGFFQLCFY